MTFHDLEIGAKFTSAPSGNGTIYTKISHWRFSYIDSRGNRVVTTNLRRDVEIYPLQSWRKDE